MVTLHAGAVGAWDWEELSNWDAGLLTDFGMDSETLTNWQRDVGALGNLLGSEAPDFQPVGIDEQGSLDQKAPVTCPECGHEFIPK